jgi:hypothetical protein
LAHREQQQEGHRQQQVPAEIELCLQRAQHLGDTAGVMFGAGLLAEGEEDRQGDQQRRHRGAQHVADMREQVGTGSGWRQVGGVRQRRQLVAEVGAGDDRAGGDRRVQAEACCHAHQADAESPGHCPRAADRQRRQCADQATG